jgi:predicted phage tail protein
MTWQLAAVNVQSAKDLSVRALQALQTAAETIARLEAKVESLRAELKDEKTRNATAA